MQGNYNGGKTVLNYEIEHEFSWGRKKMYNCIYCLHNHTALHFLC